MQVDWFTAVAQIINFLVLIGLLRRFLYGPIIKAMDDREERIASRLRQAEAREQEAKEEAQAHRQAREKLEAERAELLDQAKQEVEQQRHTMLEAARAEVEEMQSRWRTSLRQERDSFLGELQDQAARQICAITQRLLTDLADERLETRIVEVFLTRLRALDQDTREEMDEALHAASNRITVVSSFDLPEEAREELGAALREHFPRNLHLSFATSHDLACGLELRAGGRKLAWSVAAYLEALQEGLSHAIATESDRNSE